MKHILTIISVITITLLLTPITYGLAKVTVFDKNGNTIRIYKAKTILCSSNKSLYLSFTDLNSNLIRINGFLYIVEQYKDN